MGDCIIWQMLDCLGHGLRALDPVSVLPLTSKMTRFLISKEEQEGLAWDSISHCKRHVVVNAMVARVAGLEADYLAVGEPSLLGAVVCTVYCDLC